MKVCDVSNYKWNWKISCNKSYGTICHANCWKSFNWAKNLKAKLQEEEIKNIFYRFSWWSNKEKRVMLMMFKNQVNWNLWNSYSCGTDDLQIFENTTYLTDIGLTGCRDNVIGMDSKIPIQKKATTGIGGHFEVPNSCKSILQMMVVILKKEKLKVHLK